MSGPLLVLLSAGPLAGYLYVLALWQGGRHPRVVSGPVDAACLAFGVGGLLTFGPFGQVVAAILFGRPNAANWLTMALVALLLGWLWSRRSSHRLVIYHIEPSVLDRALEDVLDLRGDGYTRTLAGFEDRSRRHGLSVRVAPGPGTAVIEAIGDEPAGLIRAVGERLRARLERSPTPPATVSGLLFGLSALTMVASAAGLFLTQPHAREALRVLLQRLQGG